MTCVAVAFGASAGAVGRDLLIAVLIGVVVGLVLAFDATNRAWSIIGDRMIPLNPADSRPVAAAILVLPVVFAILLGIARLIAVVRSGPAHAYETTPGFGASAAAALPAAVLIGWLTAFVAAYSYGATGFTAPLIGLGVVIVVDVILGILGRWRSLGGFIGGASAGAVLGAVVGVFTAIAFGPRVGAALGVTAALIVWPALVSLTLYRTGFDTERLKERFYPSETIDTTKETIEWVRERMPLGRRS